MNWSLLPSLVALTLAGTMACAPEVVQTGTGGSNTGGSNAVGTGTGGAGTTGTTGSGGADSCNVYDDEPGAGSLTIRFRNDAPSDVYLPTTCRDPRYSLIETATGEDWHSFAVCLQTCEELQTQPQVTCGACSPTVLQIPPGETYDVTWEGRGLEDVEMAASCWHDGGGSICERWLTAPAGEYRVDVVGFMECEGDCTCDSEGQCAGWTAGVEAHPDVATAQFPETSLVEVVFGPCAFGCSEG